MLDNPAKRKLDLKEILRPHWRALLLGSLAVIGESVASLLEPWPLKIVVDNVLKSKDLGGWLNRLIHSTIGTDKLAIVEFAAVAVLIIAIFGAACSYVEKSVTTNVGQWVMHDMRRVLYSHVQRLSLAYHDEKRTGDLISRVTSDIDAVQSFIASGLLSVLVNCITLLGMVGEGFTHNGNESHHTQIHGCADDNLVGLRLKAEKTKN